MTTDVPNRPGRPAEKLSFEGKVAVVTGAGQGLGRSYALELAKRGARLVVNDIDLRNESAETDDVSPVDAEIREMGGEAIVSTDSVEQGERIIEQALDTFGQVDILINNAGLLRNTSFLKMTEDDWDILYRVHLLGAMRVTKAAWPHMREARYGRILMVTSSAGTFGSIGAANYATMKGGTIAFAQTLAIEGATRNILVNSVSPVAGSRLTTHIWPEAVTEAFAPELVARGVVLLVHERCPATGRVFEFGGGWASEMRWQQSEGVLFSPDFAAEDVEAQWNEITDFGPRAHAYRANDYISRIEAVAGEKVEF